MLAEIIEVFKEAVQKPDRLVQEWKEKKGGKAIGFLLTDVPEELIYAAGFFPYGLCGGKVRMDRVNAHLQFWACSYVRNCLALALNEKLDFLDGLVIPHTCDTTRMLMGIWQHAKPLPFMHNYRLPRQVERPSAKKYLIGELERFKKQLEDYRGKIITAEELWQSIRLYNSNRKLLRKIFSIHERNPFLISNRDLYTIVKASMCMDRKKLNHLLTRLVDSLPGKAEISSHKIPVFFSGTFLEPLEILDYLEESGGVVVGDDLQNGFRYIEADVGDAGDPFELLAERQLQRIPSASYDLPQNPRRNFIVQMAQRKKAQGVIFLHLKYCEPENFDYHDNLFALQKAGLPALRIESEFGDISLGQLRTRVQAFMEMIGGGVNA